MRLSHRYAGALAAGGLLWTAFPRLSWRPMAIAGAALLLLAVRGAGLRQAALLGFAAGLAFFVPLLAFLQAGAGTNVWLIVAVVQAVFFAGLGAGLAAVGHRPGWPLWSAAVWVLAEAVRGRVPLGGFTWGRLAFSQDAGSLLAWNSVGGPALVTFLVALAAGFLVTAARRRDRVGVLALAAAAAPVLAAPLLPGPPPVARQVRVALVQGNVPRLGLSAFDQRMRVLRNHAEATAQLALRVEAGAEPRPDVVIWPENSTDIDPRGDAEVAALIEAAVGRIGVPVLVGAVLDRPDGRVENAGVVWVPGGGITATYVKRHLVPYGEYVPLRRYLTPVFGRLALIPRDFAPGRDRPVLDVNGVRLGDVICFEVSYDGLVRDAVRGGAEVLVVQTNNASFGRSALSGQQLAMSRVRAVEHGRAVLVAATSGISAIVAPDGRLVRRSRIWEQRVLTGEVPLVTRRTLATRAGAWPEGLLALLGVVAVVLPVVRRG